MTLREFNMEAMRRAGMNPEQLKRSAAFADKAGGPMMAAVMDKEVQLKPGVTLEEALAGATEEMRKLFKLPVLAATAALAEVSARLNKDASKN